MPLIIKTSTLKPTGKRLYYRFNRSAFFDVFTGPVIKDFNVVAGKYVANVTWVPQNYKSNTAEFFVIEYKSIIKGTKYNISQLYCVQNFAVFIADTEWTSSEKIDASQTDLYLFTVEDLKPDTEYHFRVMAENNFGTARTMPVKTRTQKIVGMTQTLFHFVYCKR